MIEVEGLGPGIKPTVNTTSCHLDFVQNGSCPSDMNKAFLIGRGHAEDLRPIAGAPCVLGSLPGRVGFLGGFPGVAGVAGGLAVDCEVCAAEADWFDVVDFGGLGGASWSAYLACVVVAV